MPGRQAHGRPLLGAPSDSGNKKKQQRTKARANKAALDAFSRASREVGDQRKRNPRNRGLDADLGAGKRARQAQDDEDDEDSEEEGGPPKKIRRGAPRDDDGGDESEVEYGSDSSGNEWKIGVDEDNDSDIDSDEAFGESDDEKFQGYAFGGANKKNKKAGKNDDDEDDDVDGASLGSDAIDLAAALDMSMSEDDDEAGAEEDDDESGEDDSASEESDASSGSEDDDEESDEEEPGVKDWVTKFSGVEDQDEEATTSFTKAKIGLKDLGLLGLKDPQLKQSVKLLNKEEKTGKPKKLDVPLERRQQARLDRTTAYEQTNKTLDRWTETVKQNRRADHLVFPLAQTETGIARHDNSEIAPINRQDPGTELERTILGIMEASGLGPSTEKEDEQVGEDGQTLSRRDLESLWQEKRRERELKSREEARAKRIKKIKSKAYHRVHRKQRERDEMKEHEALVEAGEIDSEDEREMQDRRRAMERMGARHKDSKWAKMSAKGGRAAWDDDVRLGIADMARRDQELRRRVDGDPDGSDDDDSAYSGDSDDVDDRKRLLRELQDISDDEQETSGSKLMKMAFMQKAEAAKKKANDELVAQIRRDLASDDEEFDGSEPETEDVGRRRFGVPGAKKVPVTINGKKEKERKGGALELSTESVPVAQSKDQQSFTSSAAPRVLPGDGTGGAWSIDVASSQSRKKKGKKDDSAANVLDLDASVAVVKASASRSSGKSGKQGKLTHTADDDASDDEDRHMPIQFREQELLEKAFGGMDVVAEFEQEKHEVELEDDEKVIDNTLPGWGSWVGSGVSARDKKRHQGRFLTKQEGIKKENRKDAKLQNVIINEKRIKKNSKYLASQLPHPYESSVQYERALRLPVGPEWVTKETFQTAIKPKVIVKQGIIAPMAKPMQ
ncbi:Utp14 protein-domain-containing protein [Xylariales sp. PMI_506]|nr:Utp14 protein-domain-containing protein [Xylariales sp. PMI_506]